MNATPPTAANDPFKLQRFVTAQDAASGQRTSVYDAALAEVTRGRKTSHWMWFVFPQIGGLAFSETSKFFAITSLDEARAYLAHPTLGPRLLACTQAALAVTGRSAHDIFGSPDDQKLRSSATLFTLVSPVDSPFHRLLDKYFAGERDAKTLQMVERAARS